jgi:hypothetical protein
MDFTIIKNKIPKLDVAKFNVDNKLSAKLDKYELTHYINTSSSNIFLGSPGAGKTSTFYALFSKNLLNNCFHTIYLFMPQESQNSIDNNKFMDLPESQRFSELSLENLTYVVDEIKANPLIPEQYVDAGKIMNHAIIIDDQASHLKDKNIQTIIKDLFMNRRHLHCSLFLISQGLNLIPKPIRNVCKNWFIFNIPKNSFLELFEKHVSQITDKKLINKLYNFCFSKDKHNFLFIEPNQNAFFLNWDRLIINDES